MYNTWNFLAMNMSRISIEAELRMPKDDNTEYKFPVVNTVDEFCEQLRVGSCPLEKGKTVIFRGIFTLSSPSMIDNLKNGEFSYTKQPVRLYLNLYKEEGHTLLYSFRMNITLERCWLNLICWKRYNKLKNLVKTHFSRWNFFFCVWTVTAVPSAKN